MQFMDLVVVVPVVQRDGYGPDIAKTVRMFLRCSSGVVVDVLCPHAATSGRSLRFSQRQGRDDLRRVFLLHFAEFFALRPRGRECPFFLRASSGHSCESSRALQVALTPEVHPRCQAKVEFIMHAHLGSSTWTDTCVNDASNNNNTIRRTRPSSGRPPPPQPVLFSLYDEEPGGKAACQPGRAAGATRSGFRGSPWSSLANSLPWCRSSVPQLVEKLEDVLKIVDLPCARAGDRRAQDLHPFPSSSSSGSSCAAAGGTAGGCARAPGTRQERSRRHLVPRCPAWGGRSCWWMGGSRHVQWVRPGGVHRQPRAVFNYWAGLRSWPLWTFLWSRSSSSSSPSSISSRCLSFSSSTECWSFLLCHRVWYATVQTVQKVGDSTAQFFEVLDMPVVVVPQVEFPRFLDRPCDHAET